MKTEIKKIITALTLSLAVISAQGASNGLVHVPETKKLTTISTEKSISEKIQGLVSLPKEFLKDGYDETVKVLFLVKNNGEVENVLCVSQEPELKSAVEKQFSKIKFSQLKEKTLYTININFKVN